MRTKAFLRRIGFGLLFLALTGAAGADEPAWIRYVERGGTVLVRTSNPGVTSDTPFAIASVGKTMTAVAVLRVAERQGVSLDTPLASVLPATMARELPGLNRVTLRQALAMTSGLPDYLDDGFALAAGTTAELAARAALRHAARYPASFPPGTGFEYSNTNYVLLGLVLTHLSGQAYADAMRAEVFGPAGMSNAFVFGGHPLPPGFPDGHENGRHIRAYYRNPGLGDGGVIASARDVAAFYRALFLHRSLLSQAAMAALLRDPVGAGYGLGIDLETPVYGHSGGDLGFSSDARINVSTGAIAVVLEARGDADLDWALEAVE